MIMAVALILFLLTQAWASSVNIHLYGPHYARSREHVWVNCSSDIVPSGQYTEFVLNGGTLDSLERRTTGCFSAIQRAKCSTDMCSCSEDAKRYAIRIYVNPLFENLTVVCSMKFKSAVPFYVKREIAIRVLDLSEPTIEVNGEDVIVAGTKRILTCNVMSPLNVKMYWRCLNITSNSPKRYNFTLSISAYVEAKSSDHGEVCTCLVEYETYVTSVSLVLNISSSPIIQVSNQTVCDRTVNIQLLCIISGNLHHYGFSKWIHTINGNYLRKLNGRTRGNMSILLIDSCSFEDVGNYTCMAWNKNKNMEYWSNKSTTLTVNDYPVIAETDTITEPELQFVVFYYSVPSPVNIEWFRYEEKLENSTSNFFSSTGQTVHLPFHGVKVPSDGFRSSLTVIKPLFGEYIAVLKNEIGETKHRFKWQSDKMAFDFQKLMWGLAGVVICITTIGIVGICIKTGTIRGNEYDTNIQRNTHAAAIYYAAPGEDNYVHVYNDTEHCYNQAMNSSAGQYEEIPDSYEDINRREEERHYDVSHHYIDLDK